MMMQNDYYPGLFRGADNASSSAQKTYLLLQCLYLGSLILGSLIGVSTALAKGTQSSWLYTAIAIILSLGLLILWLARSRQDDKAWFDCRAIAESVKTATWRFMMRTPPFQSDDRLEERFIFELREIRQARPDTYKRLAGVADADSSAISEFMCQTRSQPFDRRKTFYIEGRLREQKYWYSRKAKLNARRGARWFWTTAGLQATAVIFAVIQASAGGFVVNIVPVLTTCAAAVAAWSQMKRHDELAQSYALATQELGEMDSIAQRLTIEEDFSQLVEQVEEAISREHTMWSARREVVLQRRAGDKTR